MIVVYGFKHDLSGFKQDLGKRKPPRGRFLRRYFFSDLDFFFFLLLRLASILA